MTPFDAFIQFLTRLIPIFSIWWIIKFLFVLGLLLYLCFALIVIRQVGLMAKTLKGEFALPLKIIAWIHLGAAVFVFLLALLLL